MYIAYYFYQFLIYPSGVLLGKNKQIWIYILIFLIFCYEEGSIQSTYDTTGLCFFFLNLTFYTEDLAERDNSLILSFFFFFELLLISPLCDCTTVYLIIPYGWTLGLFLIFYIVANGAMNKLILFWYLIHTRMSIE